MTANAAGELFGTTSSYRLGSSTYGFGLVYRLAPPRAGQPGWTPSVLYRVATDNLAHTPKGELTIGPNGDVYGTMGFGERHDCGAVFRLSPRDCEGRATPWNCTSLYDSPFQSLGDIESGVAADLRPGKFSLYGSFEYGQAVFRVFP